MKAKLCVGRCKALRGQMQSFAWADAKLCVGGCNALRWRMQCFALADAMLCVRVGLNWHRNVCPTLDKIKGGKTHHTGALSPQEISSEPNWLITREIYLNLPCH